MNDRILGLMPMEDHRRFFSALQTLDPIYESLVWKNSKKGLALAKEELEQTSRKVGVDEMFKKAQIFYEAAWPADRPFVIGLYPILFLDNFRNAWSSQSMGAVEEHGVMIDLKKPEGKDRGSFPVVFHELCHSIYSAQSPEVMQKWNAYFQNSSSPYRTAVKAWLNEALATAVGNGWAYKKAVGDLEKKDWYNHPIIDGFAQAIYPDVAEYLDKGKPLDRDLANKIIQRFAQTFPDSIYEYASAMNKVDVITDGHAVNPSEVSLMLRKFFSISSLGISYPLADQDSKKAAHRSPSTLVVIFSDKSVKDLMDLTSTSPSLNEKIKLVKKMKNRDILTYSDKGARTVIFIKIKSKTELEEALTFMDKAKVDPKQPLQRY